MDKLQNHTSHFVHRPSNNHCTTQASLGRVTEAGANQVSALSPRLSALAIGILLLLTPIAHAELENFQAADVVLGQPGFTQNAANNGAASPSARSISSPRNLFSDGKRLYFAEGGSHRVLIWNNIPNENFTPADVVLGQPNFSANTLNNGGISAATLQTPRGVSSAGSKLFVIDSVNHRLLIWNTVPTINFAPSDVVLGQPSFTGSAANNGGVSGSSMNNPIGIFSDGKRIFVGDQNNNRVLIWNKIPNTSSAPADVVLGQPNFSQNSANNGGVSARSLNGPRGVFTDGRRLFVSEINNHRILIWNKIPTANFADADVVLGQPDFSSNTANNGGVSARSLNQPSEVYSDDKRLFVADTTNHRVLIWNSIPTANFAPADIVLGQPNFNSNAANNGGVSAKSLSSPIDASSDGKRLFVVDFSNNRILIYNLSGSSTKPDPQFEQGKAVVGKVFNDINGNGIQDKKEKGLEGVKVVSDTGIYAITDHDGKYHFPYIETGQHVLKLDESTLPEGSTLTTDNPYKATITKGILTKVSFGVKLPEDHSPQTIDHSKELSHRLLTMDHGPLLQLSITQDTSTKPVKKLGITAEIKDKWRTTQEPLILFTTTCNYFLFIKESEIMLYDSEGKKPVIPIPLPHPVPLYFELPLSVIPKTYHSLYYQLIVRDAQGHEDRTSVGRVELG